MTHIAFDAVAAWHLEQRGWTIEEWMSNLERGDDGVGEDGRAFARWRRPMNAAPVGEWFSRLALRVDADGRGRTEMQNLSLRQWTYAPPRERGHDEHEAVLVLRHGAPDALVAAMPGRRIGEVVSIPGDPPFLDATIVSARNLDPSSGLPDPRLSLTFVPDTVEVETPLRLYP